jgi:predicted amidohydrolase
VSNRQVSVAALQLHAHDRVTFPTTWPLIRARIAAAADDGADLIVLPEGTVPAYVIGTDPVDPHLLEAAAEDVIAISSRTGATIVYGGGRYAGGDFLNSAYVVTPAGITGYADKCFLWHFDRRWFTAGETLQPIDTPLGRLGVFVCADGRIPTIASTLVDRGAELLVMATAWVTSGRDPAALENLQADLLINVRARENGVPIVVANKVGVEVRSVLYCGKSAIIAADGTFVARASQDEETTLRGNVAIAPALVQRSPEPPAIMRGVDTAPLPASLRIAITMRADPALRELAAIADASLVLDPLARNLSHEIAVAGDEAILDPRALVAPRLGGVRLFVWHAALEPAWVVPFARARAAELRAYMVVLDTRGQRAFAVDPDGTIVCGTLGSFELAQFVFDRQRTDVWSVAPGTDVREGLERVAAIEQRSLVR